MPSAAQAPLAAQHDPPGGAHGPALQADPVGHHAVQLAHGERVAPKEIVVESGQHRAYIAPPWKLIWYKDGRQSELFHLENDPLELHDRAEDEKTVLEGLSEKLHQWVDL